MVVATAFRQTVTSVAELRELLGEPSERAVKKELDHLDEHCLAFLKNAPFLLMGTSNARGQCDVSPKGDAPGFVLALDDRTIAIPDRPGNNRIDGHINVLENPHVGLLFMIPNVQETLRINGRARIVRDEALLQRLSAQGKTPLLALVVDVEQVFLHCPKAFIRSSLWDATREAGERPIASFARMLIDHAGLDGDEASVQAALDERVKTTLY
ncbi:MAG: pyridoxamine 5'-phosphate oxidase family protein [Chloroflexota bacterium]